MSSPPTPLPPDLLLIRTSVRHTVRSFVSRVDAVGVVTSGRKRVAWRGDALRIETGDLFVIPDKARLDVVNDPAGQPVYAAQILAFPPELIDVFHRQFPEVSSTSAISTCGRLTPGPELRAAFARAIATLDDAATSSALRRLHAFEVLLRLAEAGIVFAPPQAVTWCDRVRRVIATSPERAWTLPGIAGALRVSASTLQRRLADEQTSLREVLRETRLEVALGLLQSGRHSIAEIAHRCGYAAHGRFSLAFKARFGFAPSTLRPAREATPDTACDPPHSD